MRQITENQKKAAESLARSAATVAVMYGTERGEGSRYEDDIIKIALDTPHTSQHCGSVTVLLKTPGTRTRVLSVDLHNEKIESYRPGAWTEYLRILGAAAEAEIAQMDAGERRAEAQRELSEFVDNFSPVGDLGIPPEFVPESRTIVEMADRVVDTFGNSDAAELDEYRHHPGTVSFDTYYEPGLHIRRSAEAGIVEINDNAAGEGDCVFVSVDHDPNSPFRYVPGPWENALAGAAEAAETSWAAQRVASAASTLTQYAERAQARSLPDYRGEALVDGFSEVSATNIRVLTHPGSGDLQVFDLAPGAPDETTPRLVFRSYDGNHAVPEIFERGRWERDLALSASLAENSVQYRFYGTLRAEGKSYDYLVDTVQNTASFEKELREMGSNEDVRLYLAATVARLPAYEKWPPLTGRLLVENHIDSLAEDLTETTGRCHRPRTLAEMDIGKLHAFLTLLTDDISVEDTSPADPYYISPTADIEERMARRSLRTLDFFCVEEEED